MAQAKRDENNVPTLLGVLNSDGATVTPIQINPVNHALKVDDNTTGSDLGPSRALRDENFVPTKIVVSSADEITPVVLYADSSGKLLIDSN